MRSTIVSVATLIATTAAVPNVTPIPLDTSTKHTCTYWPGWIPTPDADTTGSLMFQVSGADDAAVNGLPAQPYTISFASKDLPLLAIDLRASRSIAKSFYRCADGVPKIGPSLAQNLTICKDKNNAHILVDAPESKAYVPELYSHEVDGKKQDGVFLGALNQTTWGFRYHEVNTCGGVDGGSKDGTDYYEAKLLGLPVDDENPPTAGWPSDFEGFLEVVRW